MNVLSMEKQPKDTFVSISTAVAVAVAVDVAIAVAVSMFRCKCNSICSRVVAASLVAISFSSRQQSIFCSIR